MPKHNKPKRYADMDVEELLEELVELNGKNCLGRLSSQALKDFMEVKDERDNTKNKSV